MNMNEKATHYIAQKESDWNGSPSVIQVYASREAAEKALPAAQEKYDGAEIMTPEEYDDVHRAHWLDQPGELEEIDAKEYQRMLNVLPPKAWQTGPAFSRFLLSKRTSGSIGRQYARAKIGGEWVHVRRYADHADRSTWITKAEIREWDQTARTEPHEKATA